MREDDLDPYGRVAHGFDAVAAQYEELVEANPLHHSMRRLSLRWLEEAFSPEMRVLEVGCGMGTEAIHLAQRGVKIVATDVSEAMIEGTRSKVKIEGLQDRVDVRRCAAGELSSALSGERFDGAYASFGPLNCEPNLEAALEGIASRLKPRAPFLASLVSRPCAFELAYGASVLSFRKAFRRMSEVVEIDLYGTGSIAVKAYSEGEVRAALAPRFELNRLEGLLVTLPPPYAIRAWKRLNPLHAPAEWLDGRLRHLWPFRGLGDHLHIWATRRG